MKKLLCTLLLTTSCVQRYTPPPLVTPSADTWKAPEEISTATLACPKPEIVLSEYTFRPWWTVFQDPILSDLEKQAIANSPTVQAAIARLEQSYAFYGITRSTLFPEIELDAAASRQRLSKTQSLAGAASTVGSSTGSGLSSRSTSSSSAAILPPPIILPLPTCNCPLPPAPPTPKVTKPSLYVNQFALLPTLNYELDFWGKNWQGTESASFQVKASEEDVQTALLVLTTNLADAYLQVRTYDAELDILEKTVQTRQNNYDLNLSQYNAGLINKLPVDEAKSDLEGVKSSLEDVKRLRAIAQNSLAELVGMPAPIFSLEKVDTLPTLPEIPAGVPAAMLKRRPDIRQQEDLIQAASLNVGVAKTEYFPDFTIMLDYGLLSSHANKLFKWKSHTWMMAADAVTPIFTAGRIASQIDQAIAQYKQQVADYINTVLISFKEVEDALSSVEYVKKQFIHLQAQVEAANEGYQIADERYKAGLEDYIVVVNNERTLLDSQRLATQVKRAEYSSTISLIKSLGGAWDDETMKPDLF